MGCSQSTQVVENKKIQRIQRIQKLQKPIQIKSTLNQIPERNQSFIIGIIGQNQPIFAHIKPYSMSINKMSIPLDFKCYNFSSILQINKNQYFISGGITHDLTNISNETYIYHVNEHKVERQENMLQARYTHGSIKIKQEVYVIGGRYYGNDEEGILKSCQKYNFKQKKWTKLPDMNISRCTSFIFVWNEVIYVLGGYTGPYERQTKIEYFNEKKQKWQLLNVQLNRGLEGAILLPTNNNEITIFGGLTNSGPTQSVISINLKQQTIKSRKKLSQKRSLAKSFYKNKKVYIFGGDDNFTCEIYDIQLQKSQLIQKEFPIKIQDFDNLGYSTASVIVPYLNDKEIIGNNNLAEQYSDQIVYIFGSTQQPFLCQLNISIPDVQIHSIPLNMKLYAYQGGVQVNKKQFLLFGGIQDDSLSVISADTYLFNIKVKKAVKLAKMKQNRYAFAYQKQTNSKGEVEFIYCFGGATSNNEGKLVCLNACQRYSMSKNEWQLISPLPSKLISPMSLTFNEKIFVFGGTNQKDIKCKDIFMYNKQSNSWITINDKLPFGIEAGSVVRLNNRDKNQFYVFGGRTENGQTAGIWSIYLKQTKQNVIECVFQQKGQMNETKSLHKIYQPKHQDFFVIFGGQKHHLSCYKKKDLIQQTSDLLLNMKEMFTSTIQQLNNPNLKGYLIITPQDQD